MRRRTGIEWPTIPINLLSCQLPEESASLELTELSIIGIAGRPKSRFYIFHVSFRGQGVSGIPAGRDGGEGGSYC